jgi:pantoate--beta-alanine ligase
MSGPAFALRTGYSRRPAPASALHFQASQHVQLSTSSRYQPNGHKAATPSNSPDTSPFPFRIFRDDIPSLRQYRGEMHRSGRTLALVPTMGALHDGHLSLIRTAARENSDVFVSVFVNPTQFGPTEDLATYPRTWDDDVAKLVALTRELALPNVLGRISGIFAPGVKTMYPTLPPSSDIGGVGSFVTITPLANRLEGASRPTFFRGVATVCTKLFNIVQPDRVYFGQKDVQQSVLIRRMVQDFHIPTEVRLVPTTREPDGLAMSSRNVYLGERRRRVAPVLQGALRAAETEYNEGRRSRIEMFGAAIHFMETERLKLLDGGIGGIRCELDYLSVADMEEMNEIKDEVDPRKGAIISAALKMLPVDDPKTEEERSQKAVRLIDNIILAPSCSAKDSHEV